jgi:hypothetical protein
VGGPERHILLITKRGPLFLKEIGDEAEAQSVGVTRFAGFVRGDSDGIIYIDTIFLKGGFK